MKTLEQYFRECESLGIVDHALVAHEENGVVVGYIHPATTNGETHDFVVNGDTITRRVDGKAFRTLHNVEQFLCAGIEAEIDAMSPEEVAEAIAVAEYEKSKKGETT